VNTALRALRSPWLRRSFALLTAALIVIAVVGAWDGVRGSIGKLHVSSLVISLVAALAGTCCVAGAFRALLSGLGAHLRYRAAAQILFVGQLGKYVPGAVWVVVAQTELAKEQGATREAGATASLVLMVENVVVAVVVAVGTLAAAGTSTLAGRAYLLVAVVTGAILIQPAVIERGLAMAGRLAGRTPSIPRLKWRSLAVAGLLLGASWMAYGASFYAIAADLATPGRKLALVSVGAFALAWVVGFLIVFAPAGAGARELIVVVAMRSLMPQGAPLVAALTSRLVLTVVDVILGAIGVALVGPARLRALREGRRRD
jgi:glycosyltransferase 2 family protein